MLMDVSSEMIHALLPIYLVTVLGTSTLTVGIIEGVAEATASVIKVFSGALSDWLGKRKLLAAIGYGLAAFTKPVFPLAASVGWLVAARFVDRVGKGIRGAPRDALIADFAPAHLRGASFGLRQSLDVVGAVLGPLAAIALMMATADSIATVFWIAVVPAFASFGFVIFGVSEPERPAIRRAVRFPLQRAEIARLPRAFWFIAALAFVLTLARFSEAFLLLKAQDVGVPLALVPAVLVLMNVAYAATAYPAGVAADGPGGRSRVLMLGLAALLAADLVLAFAPGVALVGLGAVLWGLHMGLTQGILAALVADTAPEELRGTAFGLFNLIVGAALLLASILAGVLWDALGSRATFLAGAAFTAIAIAGFARALYNGRAR
ncbi:MAG: MFS transporter [Alphaproteobacteria bacterium]|nr:MFS transporter [Alphaproteobacteria bacterium]